MSPRLVWGGGKVVDPTYSRENKLRYSLPPEMDHGASSRYIV